MKKAIIYSFGWLVLTFLAGCHQTSKPLSQPFEAVEVPGKEWNAGDIFFDKSTSRWKLKKDSSNVSGKIISYFQHGEIAKIIPVYEGKKEGIQLTYFIDGKLRFSEQFVNNKLHGTVKKWTNAEGYQLLAELQYNDGKLHGLQKQWFASGELHKVLQMDNGKENGLQKAYRKNGALYANYEAINGRTFGMRRTELCYELDDEEVVYKN